MRHAFPLLIPLAVCLAGWTMLLAAQGAGGEIWIDVPFVRQSGNGCGSACLAMIIRYWDGQTNRHSIPRESEPAIYQRLYSRKAAGIPAIAMKQYLEEQGFRAYAFEGTWKDLQQHLSKGRPLIVCLKHGAVRHYTVVSGMDADRDIVLTNDPDGKKLQKLSRAEFERGWKGSDNWTLIALP